MGSILEIIIGYNRFLKKGNTPHLKFTAGWNAGSILRHHFVGLNSTALAAISIQVQFEALIALLLLQVVLAGLAGTGTHL